MRKSLLLLVSLAACYVALAQTAINKTNTPAHPSAMLDVASTSRGLLMPRMTTAQRNAIVSPATGLMVYDLTTKTTWYYDTQWKQLATVGTSDSSFVFMNNTPTSYNMANALIISDSAGFIYDSGGPVGGYGNSEDITTGIVFPPGSQLCRIQVISLNTEAGGDSLTISLGDKNYTFSGNVTNQSVFFNFSYSPVLLHFVSNSSSTQAGYQIRFDHYFLNPNQTTDLDSTQSGFYYIPEKVAVRGGFQTDNTWYKDSVGINSFAFGYGPKAKGDYAFAAGLNTSADGTGAVAMGGEATATGRFSTATGYSTSASGNYASASGFGTVAKGFGTTVVGTYNDSILTNDEITPFTKSPLFMIGNGFNDNNRSNAVTVLRNGSVGIGTSAPDAAAALDITGTKGVLLPRITSLQRTALGSVPAGLIVYQTDVTPGYYFYNGSAWVSFQDNLGNHTLTQNLVTGGNYISRDGTSQGLQILTDGGFRMLGTNIAIPATIAERMRVDGSSGFVLKGILGIGTIPATGGGERMMWHPYKAAFRAGSVGSGGTYWDDANVGFYTTAFGYNTIALGLSSFATGYQSQALGSYSNALGYTCIADGTGAVAIGYRCTASADYSVAMGQRAGANGHAGSLTFSDASTTDSTLASVNNQFTARYAGGYRLFANATKSVGVSIVAGGNSWASISDSTKKENFATAGGEIFLDKLTRLKLGSWNYKGQSPENFRHYGPMAQEIFAAFGKDKYGTIGNDTTVASADMDGIMMIMLQGLEKRTQKVKQLEDKVQMLEKENGEIKKQLEEIMKMLKK